MCAICGLAADRAIGGASPPPGPALAPANGPPGYAIGACVCSIGTGSNWGAPATTSPAHEASSWRTRCRSSACSCRTDSIAGFVLVPAWSFVLVQCGGEDTPRRVGVQPSPHHTLSERRCASSEHGQRRQGILFLPSGARGGS
eukprot:scaffold17761_cov213-Isochrysis_galbana.AAC.2